MKTPDELRKIRRQYIETCQRLTAAYHQECERVAAILESDPLPSPPPKYPPKPVYPPYPEECRGLTCGAKTRAGTPCKRMDLQINGRCKLHGGMSTGPRTPEGKARSARNGFKPGRRLSS